MKPFAVFAVVVLVGGIVLAVGLRLTDHSASATPPPRATSAPRTLSRAQFVRAANRICLRSDRQGKAVFRKPKSLHMLTREFRVAVPLLDREVATLRALMPPSRDAATWRRLLNDLGPEQRQMHVIRHAFETRQWVRGVAAARQLVRLGKLVDRRDDPILRKLGLTVCARD
jgi:hypothetical protein